MMLNKTVVCALPIILGWRKRAPENFSFKRKGWGREGGGKEDRAKRKGKTSRKQAAWNFFLGHMFHVFP